MDKWVDNVILGLGSNMGDRSKMLKEATLLISSTIGEIMQESSIYETKAWGNNQLNDFYNQVIVIRTQFNPMEVLQQCLDIEKQLGKTPKGSMNYENRLIDIDLLFYNEFCCKEKNLVLPHPHIAQRNFVLEPLAEIAPDFIHPELGLSIRILQQQSEDRTPLKRLG